MFSFIFDLQLALHYDIPTYSVKNSDTTNRYTGRSLQSVVSVLSVVTSVMPTTNADSVFVLSAKNLRILFRILHIIVDLHFRILLYMCITEDGGYSLKHGNV